MTTTVKKTAAKPDLAIAPCACPVEGRKAIAVDPGIKTAVTRRLARMEGQIRGLQKMVQEERYCADILVQISSVQEALRGVSRELLKNHLKHCATDAIRKGPESAETMYQELLDLVYRHAR
jgi:DNA-binding FrmR family transcriptional regulator